MAIEILKVLYLHRTQARGAEGTHITKIVSCLRELGHEVDVMSPPGINPFSASNSAPVDKAKVRTKGLATIWKSLSKYAPQIIFELAEMGYNFSLWVRMSRKLKEKNYDVIYERYAFFTLAGAVLARKHDIPFILEANELCGVKVRSRPQSLIRACRYFEEKLLARCDHVFVVSSTLENMLEDRGVPKNKICVLPNAIDKAALKIDSGELDFLKARFALDEKIVIGCVGWFDKWDRLDFLISAYRKIADGRNDTRLMLIGDGPSVADAKLQVADCGLEQKVIFSGAVDKTKIFAYQSLLDIAVLPHSNDYGSPVVLFELLGLGIPVIAPTLPPIMDVVVNNETAMLFEPLNTDDCVNQMERLVQSAELRSRLSVSGTDLVQKEHTWIGNAAKIAQSMNNVCAK